ncbi:MAG TPA: S8 family peptidase [Longimicrobiaceae bacterium]|nr:S8 family peptidase [Longimicrobiaceae bacterium]
MRRSTLATGASRGAVVASLVALAACSTDQIPSGVSPDSALEPSLSASRAGGHEFVPGEVIVKFRAGTPASAREAALQAASARVSERIVTGAMRGAGDHEGITVMHSALGTAGAIERLRGNPAVEYAEPNWIYRHTAVSDDPFFVDGSLWGMYGSLTSPANQYGSQAGSAWAAGHIGAKTVYVGVIDEGIQFDHPDLAVNVWLNPFDPADGVDNDGNGYVDDTRGWDFANGDNSIYDGGTRGSLDKHGTHVAGTIGALGGNGLGVAGVNWSVTMISGKFLGRNGGTTTNAIKAVDYFTDLKTRHGLNIVATNNSWGGGGFSQALLDAINRGGNAGILFIAAAGNGGADGVGDNNDTSASYPSNYECTANGTYDCVIAVASITSSGAKSGFSNYGAKTVDLGAPGSGVYSTLPYNTYGSYSGTSMATPHVAGGAALYASTHPGATAAQIRGALMSSTTPTPSLDGRTVTGGRLNVSGF